MCLHLIFVPDKGAEIDDQQPRIVCKNGAQVKLLSLFLQSRKIISFKKTDIGSTGVLKEVKCEERYGLHI